MKPSNNSNTRRMENPMLRDACQRWISSEEDDHQRAQKHQLHNKSRGSQIPRERKTAADSLQEKQSVKKAVNAET